MAELIERFKVVAGSQSAHCCFEATVVDTMRPDGEDFTAVCECMEAADAETIAASLNMAYSWQQATPTEKASTSKE